MTVLSDYVLWFILGAGLIVGILAADWENLPFIPKKERRIQLDVADAYSITKGSQVILMGIPVGQITRVEPDVAGDRVWVSFALKPNMPQIPTHAEAAITAAGLGGAKALEFYVMREGDPNDSDPSVMMEEEKSIHVIAPFRERTMRKYQVTSANSIRNGAKSLGDILDQVEIGQHEKDLNWILGEIKSTQRAMEQFSKDVPKLNNQMDDGVADLQHLLEQSQQRLDHIVSKTPVLDQPGSETAREFTQKIREARKLIDAQREQLNQLQKIFKSDDLEKNSEPPPAPSP